MMPLRLRSRSTSELLGWSPSIPLELPRPSGRSETSLLVVLQNLPRIGLRVRHMDPGGVSIPIEAATLWRGRTTPKPGARLGFHSAGNERFGSGPVAISRGNCRPILMYRPTNFTECGRKRPTASNHLKRDEGLRDMDNAKTEQCSGQLLEWLTRQFDGQDLAPPREARKELAYTAKQLVQLHLEKRQPLRRAAVAKKLATLSRNFRRATKAASELGEDGISQVLLASGSHPMNIVTFRDPTQPSLQDYWTKRCGTKLSRHPQAEASRGRRSLCPPHAPACRRTARPSGVRHPPDAAIAPQSDRLFPQNPVKHPVGAALSRKVWSRSRAPVVPSPLGRMGPVSCVLRTARLVVAVPARRLLVATERGAVRRQRRAIGRFVEALQRSGEVADPIGHARRVIRVWNKLAAERPALQIRPLTLPPQQRNRWTLPEARSCKAFART